MLSILLKILVLLNFNILIINCAGLFEECHYKDQGYPYLGQCQLKGDCENAFTHHCDYSLVCCARIYYEERTIGLGGVEALQNEFPHMALIGYEANDDDDQPWRCSGSIVTSFFILSAAHCNSESIPKSVLLGVNNFQMNHGDGQIRSIIEIIDHPEYDFNQKINDICLYRLNASITFGVNVRLICLPEVGQTYLSDVIATGWGATSLTSGMSENLLKMLLSVWDKIKCTVNYNETIQICAGSNEAIDTCSGDSGGPLQVEHRPSEYAPCSYTIIGITSHGKACLTRNGTVSIYTKVSSYLRWIKDIVWHGTMNCDYK